MLFFDHCIFKRYQKVPSCINLRVQRFCHPLQPLCTVHTLWPLHKIKFHCVYFYCIYLMKAIHFLRPAWIPRENLSKTIVQKVLSVNLFCLFSRSGTYYPWTSSRIQSRLSRKRERARKTLWTVVRGPAWWPLTRARVNWACAWPLSARALLNTLEEIHEASCYSGQMTPWSEQLIFYWYANTLRQFPGFFSL